MSKKTLDFKYVPIIVKIKKDDQSIFNEDSTINFSSNVDYPRSEFCFHHFIHASKNKLEILKKFDGKKKVYLIHNQFEPHVDDNSSSIEFNTLKQFGLNEVHRNFYKMMEIISIFGISDNSSSLSSAHLGETTGGFVQALISYRDENAKKSSKSDKYHVLSDEIKNVNKPIYDSIKSKISSQKTFSDIKCDLVTSDVNISHINLNIYEQLASEQIIRQIISMANILNKNGTFVCKFYETFTMTSVKLISILTELFDIVYFVKPLISELSDSEKFAVCIRYKKDSKQISSLNNLLKTLNSKTENQNVTDLYENFKIPRNILLSVSHLNREMSNYQFKSINNIVNFIKKEIYFGEEFHDKNEEQIECGKYWTQMFISSKTYPDLVEKIVKESNDETSELADKIVINL